MSQSLLKHSALRQDFGIACFKGSVLLSACQHVYDVGSVCSGQPEMLQKTFAMLACACFLCSAMLTAPSCCSSIWCKIHLHQIGHKLRRCSTGYTSCFRSRVCRYIAIHAFRLSHLIRLHASAVYRRCTVECVYYPMGFRTVSRHMHVPYQMFDVCNVLSTTMSGAT